MTLQQYYMSKFEQLSTRAKNILKILELDHTCYTLTYATCEDIVFSIRNCGKHTAHEIIEFINDIASEYPFNVDKIDEYIVNFQNEAILIHLSTLSVYARRLLYRNKVTTYTALLTFLTNAEISSKVHMELAEFKDLCEDWARRSVLLSIVKVRYGHKIDNILDAELHHCIHSQNLRDSELKIIEQHYYSDYYNVLNVYIGNSKNYPELYEALCHIRTIFVERLKNILNDGAENIVVQIDYNPKVKFSKNGSTLIHFPKRFKGEYRIPKSVNRIKEGAFEGCVGLDSIVIPNGVTIIEDNTFRGCVNLRSVQLPESLIEIKDGAFAYCINLKTLTIPKSTKITGSSLFEGCKNIELTIPKHLRLSEEDKRNCIRVIYY